MLRSEIDNRWDTNTVDPGQARKTDLLCIRVWLYNSKGMD